VNLVAERGMPGIIAYTIAENRIYVYFISAQKKGIWYALLLIFLKMVGDNIFKQHVMEYYQTISFI
jgi:hypothetical protein